MEADFAKGGNTNVDELGLACGPDNRDVNDRGGWTTRMNDRCEVEWIPPPALDTGQARVNNYHRPERLLRPPDDPEPPGDNTIAAEAASAGTDQADPRGDAESDAPQPTDDPGEPGGPAPPGDQAA